MVEREKGSLSELAKFGFIDLSASMAKLDQLVSAIGDPARSCVAFLAKSADPDQALDALLKLAETDKSRLKKLLGKPDAALRLCLVLGASSALAEFIHRVPASLDVFDQKAISLRNQAEYTDEVRRDLNPLLDQAIRSKLSNAEVPFNLDALWSALRVAYRKQLLEISIFDLTQSDQQVGLPQVAAALADIAGAAIECAIDIARAELAYTSEQGSFDAVEVAATKFSVIAMGKCGARELNYISDVDVIFVAESGSSEVESQRAVEIATKLATRMMRAIDGNAQEPMLWQVDPNLRPEGKSGALVRTLESHLAYYDRWAQSWEFQALLKARHLAGDSQLSAAYVSSLNPKVWVSSHRENFVENVQKMRQRVLEHIAPDEVDRQIKLGPGGLRDVEFTVQLLQLVHGRSDDSVRDRDTLGALKNLSIAGYVAREDADLFASRYRYLRFLEHRIQLSELRRTHLMPTDELKLRQLARSVNVKQTGSELLEHWETVKAEVRGLHQKLFYKPLLSAVARLDDASTELTGEQAGERLRAIGFEDTKGALEHIRALTSGISRRANIQRGLLPVLLEWFASGTDPDAGLLAFRRLSEDLGESPWFLKMLRDSSGAAARLTQVLANSKLATTLFEKNPEAAAWFDRPEDLQPATEAELDFEIQSLLERHESIESATAALRAIRRRETLRLAIAAVVGDLTFDELAESMSAIFEAYLLGVLESVLAFNTEKVADKRLAACVDFGIIAMGRFGGQELGFGSDADLMFVYLPIGDTPSDDAQKAAEKIASLLMIHSKDSLLEFEVDLGLRPEGKNGPVVRSLSSYKSYYQRWGSIWENQALLRARPIAGSVTLQSQFVELANVYRYPEKISDQSIIEIRRIKARVETERLPQGADPKRHLKLGRGSLSDVEWLVQILQLKHGNQYPSIRTPKTLEALRQCVEFGLIEAHDAKVLENAWMLASRVRSASVLWQNKRNDVLPVDRKQLEGLARILEYAPFSAGLLEQDYLAATRRARSVFERIFYEFKAEE